jgi:hypothetical protein
MRKLIVCNIVSLDGSYSGPGWDVMAMPFDDGFSDYNAERLRADSLKPDEVEGWGKTRLVRRADAHAEVAALKERPGWTSADSKARACSWSGTPSSADRDAALVPFPTSLPPSPPPSRSTSSTGS